MKSSSSNITVGISSLLVVLLSAHLITDHHVEAFQMYSPTGTSSLLTCKASLSSSKLHMSMSSIGVRKSNHNKNKNKNKNNNSKSQSKCPLSRLNMVAIAPPAPPAGAPTTMKEKGGKGDETRKSWDCDEEAVCTEVEACDEQQCRTSLDVRIHGTWYDLSGWRKAHPAGAHWIDWYDGRDGTEVMDGFHTIKARDMYARLPKSKPDVAKMLEKTIVADSHIQKAFRELRVKLEVDGWWERNMVHEAKLFGLWSGCVIGAAVFSRSIPKLATFLLSLSFTQAGWLGHDYIHGVDKFAKRLRFFCPLAGGLHPTWWSDKHNKHHALTNEKGVDEDIATDPFLYQWAPDPANDSPLRRIQHWIFYIPFSFLFALWRFDSMKQGMAEAKKVGRARRPFAKGEFYSLLIHYAIVLTVYPIKVWCPAILLSGLMSALIVTPTHQSEEMFDEYQSDWVTAQFQSTRNAVTNNPFSEWLWGGMQYQLEHHLFPSMPRSKYPKLRSILMKFAEDNKIPGGYRETGEFEIQLMNWRLYRKVARADPVPGAFPTKGLPGQLGAICNGFAPTPKPTVAMSN